MQKRILILIAIMMLTACASKKDDNRETTESQHYREARELLERKTFLNAIEALEELEARFPFGTYAEQAQLDLIYARYRALDYPAAIAQADRFIRTNPNHQHLDYALYMRGVAYYNMNQGMFEEMFKRKHMAHRDLTSLRDAFRDFDELVRRFPDSEFAPDARTRMLHLRNTFAENELVAARYYARRKAYIAAANRAQAVIRHYQGTLAVPEAVAILGRAYDELGQPDLRDNALRILKLNWPDSEWLKDDGRIRIEWWPEKDRSWLSLISFDLLG